MTYGYNRDTDYSALIADAVANGDYASAAIYEAQRNEKIAGEGLQYEQTNQYTAYLPSSYTNPYTDALNDAIANLQDDSAFKKRYLQEADRTMHDVLGQYGTMTGGLPSTQAVAAASQAADYYKSQLDEKLYEHNRQNVNLLLSAGSQAQSEYQMMISEALTRWSQLGYADEHVAQILGVNVGTPTSDQSYINWQQGQSEHQMMISEAMSRWSQLGYADEYVAQILGVDVGTPTSDQSYINWQQGQSEHQMMISEALSRWSQLGYADEYVAQILGVDVGTPTSDQSYIDWQQGQQEQSAAYNMAMMLLQAGQMPGADTLAAAGISAEDAQTLLNAYTTPSYSGGSGSGSSGSTGGSSSTGEPGSTGSSNETGVSGGTGLSDRGFAELMGQLNIALTLYPERIETILQNAPDNLSPEQMDYILSWLWENGL